MRKIVFSVLLIGVVVSASVGAYLTLSESGQSAAASIPPATSIVSSGSSSPGVLALNAVVDASGVKSKIDGALRAREGEIAQHLGLSEGQVDVTIDMLDIQEWEVADLPGDAVESSSYTVDCQGSDLQITTYVDSSYVTVGLYGQDVTLAIPETAQDAIALLALLA